MEFDEPGPMKCKKCPRKGYYKNGLCIDCRPKCPICNKRINGHKGVLMHPICSERSQRWAGEGRPGTKGYVYSDMRAEIKELNS